MKIKTDFVTNSSSSSFIVAFPNVIENLKDVAKFIKDIGKAKTVFNDCKKQNHFDIEPSNKCYKKIIQELTQGTPMSRKYGALKESIIYSPMDHRKYMRKEIEDDELVNSIQNQNMHEYYDIVYLQDDMQRIMHSATMAEKFVKKNLGKFLYLFEYGDEDGSFFSEMEHGGTFDELEHIQVSKH